MTNIPLDLRFRMLHSGFTTEEYGRFTRTTHHRTDASGTVRRPATERVTIEGTNRLIGRGSTTGPGPRRRGRPRRRGLGRRRETGVDRGASGAISMDRLQSGIARQSARTDGRCEQIERQATAGSSICGGSPDAGRPGRAWFRPGPPGRSHVRAGIRPSSPLLVPTARTSVSLRTIVGCPDLCSSTPTPPAMTPWR